MELKIAMCCDNAAFEGQNGGSEAARILRRLAAEMDGDALEDGERTLRDINGNKVGLATVSGQQEADDEGDEDGGREVRPWNEGESDAERNA